MKHGRAAADRHPTPLSPQVFQILVSRADEPRHGYAMIQDIRERTDGEVLLTASTLSDALARLVDRGWIEEGDDEAASRRPAPSTAAQKERRWSGWRQDSHHAWRNVLRAPGHALTVILCLGLAVSSD